MATRYPARYGAGSVAIAVAITGAFLLASLVTLQPAGGGTAGLVARAFAAKPRIAVVGVTAEQLSGEVRAKIDAAVAGGLAASGAEVVDSTTTARRIANKGLGGCETSTCRVAIAEVTGAAYLVRGSVESMGRSYTVRLEMIDGATGSVIGMREDRCDICTESEAYETASVTASALKAEVIKRPAPSPAGAGTAKPVPTIGMAPPQPAAAHDTTTILAAPATVPAPAPESAPRFRALSWIGIGAGVAAAVAGAYLISIDSKQLTCVHTNPDPLDKCPHSRATGPGGYALAGGGVLAVALGVTLLVGRF